MVNGKMRTRLVLLAILAVSLVVAACSNNNEPAVTETTTVVTEGSSIAYQWGDKNFENFVRKAAEGRTLKIGFTPPAASEFYDIIEAGANTMMNELSDRFGVKFEFEMSAPNEHQSVESQVATIENWTAKKYDAILVSSAGDFDAMNAVYQKAMDAGTAIFMFNMPAEMWDEKELKAVSVISYNNQYQAGYIVGKYAAEKLQGKGKILLVWGLPGHWSTSRKNGFLEAIKPYPDKASRSTGCASRCMPYPD